VEDGNAAQRTRSPFLMVLVEVGVNGLQEGTDEGDFPRGTDD
jgi:hypothetical protein